MTVTNTYLISGPLERTELIGIIKRLKHRQIYREVKAVDAAEAVDSFEVDGWEWIEAPVTRLITEAMKMERGGQPSLFPLEGVNYKY